MNILTNKLRIDKSQKTKVKTTRHAKRETKNAKRKTRTEAKPSSPKANILDNIKTK